MSMEIETRRELRSQNLENCYLFPQFLNLEVVPDYYPLVHNLSMAEESKK
jgi:hypothetical protein